LIKQSRVSSKRVLLLLVCIFSISVPLSVASADDGIVSTGATILSDVKSIAAGPTSGYAIKKDGSAWAWGGGVPLGDGKNSPSSIPVKLNIDHVKQIAAGGHHTLILKQDGTVWAIGANEHGQLGNGKKSTAIQQEPVQVSGLKNIKAVAAGANHSLAITKDEHVLAWGGNEDGQIGNGSRKDALRPVEVKNIVRVHRIVAGRNVSITLGGGGEIFVWGLQQVKKGHMNVIRKPTELISPQGGSVEFFGVFAEDSYAAGLDALGRVWLWNNQTSGKPGATLKVVDGFKDGVSVTIGCAVNSDGTVWQWTSNKKGKYVLTQVPGITNASAISKGRGTYYVLLKDGHIVSWGANEKGQAGIGSKDKTVKTPMKVVGPAA
jgi:alpha-tubulin suppressor-like RCC1 family protein